MRMVINNMNETNYVELKGMHCPNCPPKIERAVSEMDGVTEISVNLATEKGRVTFDKSLTGISEIINKIHEVGFEAKKIQK